MHENHDFVVPINILPHCACMPHFLGPKCVLIFSVSAALSNVADLLLCWCSWITLLDMLPMCYQLSKMRSVIKTQGYVLCIL